VPAAIADLEPGDEVEVVYYRGDERKTTRVELGKRPSSLESAEQEQDQDDGGGIPDLP
jgi:hypothetical protein